MKRFIRIISIVLLVCFFNSSMPIFAFSADVESTINQLTPQQKDQLKNLTPEDKNKIKDMLGENTTQQQPVSGQNNVENKPEIELQKQSVLELMERENATEAKPSLEKLSPIEIQFQNRISDETQNPLKQFGYEVFDKNVSNQFALIPTIPLGPDYRINARDKLLVTIWGNVNDTFSLTVDDRGTVTFPRVGVITVAGLEIEEARDLIYQRLAKVFVTDFNIDMTIKEIGAIKVYLLGNFVQPGAYTILANTSIYDAIFLGGGPAKSGSLRNIELVRNGVKIKTIDLYDFIITGKRKNDILLESGDVVKISSIVKTAAIAGNVNNPAIYELKSKIELSDFINLAGGITPTTYLQRVQIQRYTKNTALIAFDVNYSDYLKNKHIKPVYIDNMDFISIFSINEELKNVVYLTGNVARAGQYQLKPNMRLLDLIKKAEGLLPETYIQRAQIYRLEPPDMKPRIIAIDLNKMKDPDLENNPKLFEFDRVRVFSKSEIEGFPKVYIAGEINDGDKTQDLTYGMKISDLIFQAGGVKESAYLERAELARTEKGQVVFYTINLKKILVDKDKNEDILLQKHDYLFVRETPDYGINETVVISGEVKYPGKYVIYKGERLSSLIDRAGGFTGNAFLAGTIFIRESLKEKQLNAKRKISNDFESKRNWELAHIPVDVPSNEVSFRLQLIDIAAQFANKKMEMEIPGRLVLELSKLSKGNEQDIVLQNNDNIYVPEEVNGITVMGEVYFPGTILFRDGKSIDYYVDLCGGSTEYADASKSLLLRANGMVEANRWGVSPDPGDSILVPVKSIQLAHYEKPFNWNDFWETSSKAATVFTQTVSSFITIYLLYKALNKS